MFELYFFFGRFLQTQHDIVKDVGTKYILCPFVLWLAPNHLSTNGYLFAPLLFSPPCYLTQVWLQAASKSTYNGDTSYYQLTCNWFGLVGFWVSIRIYRSSLACSMDSKTPRTSSRKEQTNSVASSDSSAMDSFSSGNLMCI